MICLLDPHDLSSNLARHLAKTDANERTIVRTHGLLSASLPDAFRELRLFGMGARTSKPGAHAILSPSIAYDQAMWEVAWEGFEETMGLTGQPYVEVRHLKLGRGGRTAEHCHRVYSRIDESGRSFGFRTSRQSASWFRVWPSTLTGSA
ncbi:MAG: hypothetical protein HC788_04935 [Sphingopyxis sp.]|nr:hypothetical protein [Sphingopyxis sp.]